MKNLLRGVSQKLENDLLKFLRASTYQYGDELITMVSPASGRFGAVDVDSMLKYLEKKRFLRITLSSLFWTAVTAVHAIKSLLLLDSRAPSEPCSPFG